MITKGLTVGQTLLIPVSFGHIVSDKARRTTTGAVEAEFISYHDTDKQYARVLYCGEVFVVSVGQILN